MRDSAGSVSAALARARRSPPLRRSLGRVAVTRCPRSRSLVALHLGRLPAPGRRLAPRGWRVRRRRRPRPEAPRRPRRPRSRGTSRSCSIAGSSIGGAAGSATSAVALIRRSQTTVSTNRLAALSRAPGVEARGRPVNGALTTTSSRGPLLRTGGGRGRQSGSGITRTVSRTRPAAMMIISRRSLPRVCRKSLSARRPKRSGSTRPWLPSKLRSRSAVGSVQDATAGICLSVIYAINATERGPRQECSHAGSQIRAGIWRPSGVRLCWAPCAGGGAGTARGYDEATCRGTGLVRGPALSSLPPRPVGRAAPHRFAAFAHSRSDFVAGTARAATSYTWALARRVLNRLAHICTGNISAWAGVAAALAAPVLFSVQKGSVGVVDDTLAAVAQQSADLIHEVGTEPAALSA